MILKTPFNLSLPVFIAFTLTLAYWSHLIIFSEMVIAHDAVGYEYFGKQISTDGWAAYLKNGPAREPIYPFLIALSMHIANILKISYQTVHITLQFGLLLISQILVLLILKRLNVNKYISACTILYIGISPAMINSALRLFSEIAAYPLLLAVVIFAGNCWLSIRETNSKSIYFNAAMLGLFLSLSAFIKGIFEIVAPIYLSLFLAYALIRFFKKDKLMFHRALIIFVISFISFSIPTNLYKFANYLYNGHFTLTDRGSWALYGQTARRMEPLTWHKFKGALASVPGEGFCRSVVDPMTCYHWSYGPSNDFGVNKRNELKKKGVPDQQLNKELMKATIAKAMENPFQYVLLFSVESLKMYFWESFSMAYMVLPEALIKVYKIKPLRTGLFFTMPVLNFLTMVFLLVSLWLGFKKFLNGQLADNSYYYIFSLFSLIVLFVAGYSFFLIHGRYMFPLASLYLIGLAYAVEKLGQKKIGVNSP